MIFRESRSARHLERYKAVDQEKNWCAVANSELSRLQAALDTVVKLVIVDSAYVPIFDRLQAEITAASEAYSSLERARAISARQKARG